jgi:protein TonB
VPPDLLSTASPNQQASHKEWAADRLDSQCAFPAEVEDLPIDRAVVTIAVDVGPDGKPVSVAVLSDPGHGFGDAAQRCAMAQRYVAARDASGRAIASRLCPIRVRFVR